MENNANKESQHLLGKEQIEQLAHEMAGAIASVLSRSVVSGKRRAASYNCTGESFACSGGYSCSADADHGCTNTFQCGAFECRFQFEVAVSAGARTLEIK